MKTIKADTLAIDADADGIVFVFLRHDEQGRATDLITCRVKSKEQAEAIWEEFKVLIFRVWP